MKNLLFKFLAITMIVGFSANVMAQSSATSDAVATLITPISIVNDVQMDFQTIAASNAAGTVVMTASATAALSATGGVTVISGTPTAGKFTVTGETGQTFAISLPSNDAALTRTGGGTITVDTWTCSETDLGNVTLSSATKEFYVGGTLNVDGNALGGLYEGTFDVEVNYN